MANIRIFEVGYCTHPACMAQKGAGLASRKFPARAYLIETKSGCYLFDTGYSEQFHTHAKGIYKTYGWVTPVHYQHNQEHLVAQLANVGVRPSDIRGILISHFHADHIAGLSDYPHVPLYAAKDAVRSIRGLKGVSALQKAFIPGLLPSDFESRLRILELSPLKSLPAKLAPFDFGWHVDPLGEIVAVELPGHAEGHVGAFVHTEQGWTLLAADAAWAVDGYRVLNGPSELSFIIQHSRKAYLESLHKLHRLYLNSGADIYLSHQSSPVVRHSLLPNGDINATGSNS